MVLVRSGALGLIAFAFVLVIEDGRSDTLEFVHLAFPLVAVIIAASTSRFGSPKAAGVFLALTFRMS